MRIFFEMVIPNGLADEYSSQVGKDVRLDKGYQHFNQIDKHCKSDRHRRKSYTCSFCHLAEDEDQAHEAQDNDVACGHIREKTNNECKGLGKHSH